MNKTLVIIATVAIISVGGIISFLALNSDQLKDSAGNTADDAKVEAASVKDACDILTKARTEEILGTKVKLQTNSPLVNEDQYMTMSVCSYVSTGTKDFSGAQLLVRSAKNKDGKKANKSQFDSTKPSNYKNVEGIGDEAYFSRDIRQLNVLVGGNWYIVTLYSSTDENVGSLENTKLLADKLNFE